VTKQLLVLPENVRRTGSVDLGAIPVNSYANTMAGAIESDHGITAARVRRIYFDMVIIRTFETMLDQIKKLGSYEGIEYQHAGPAHLSIGQEAAAVGQCVHLNVSDHLFGSHRSHGEILAKGLRAIEDLAGNDLESVMQSYFDGAILRVVDQTPSSQNGTSQLPDLTAEQLRGIDFLLYGLLAEVFGREPGFNRGMGGSMHAFFMPFGVYPNNAIVGGSADIATGAALYKKIRKAEGIAIANIGDAAIGCGPVWEAMGFSSMGQFNNLWDEAHRGGLPMVFNFMNNFYGMGGQPIGETMGFERLARAGAAINPDNMHAECVDGNNPLAVADAYARLIPKLADGQGPALLEVICYRQSGHSPSDQSSYREREEIERWQAVDPLLEFGGKLIDAELATQADLDAVQTFATAAVRRACEKASSLEISPRMKLVSGADLEALSFSNETAHPLPGLENPDDVLIPYDENPRVQQIAKKSRRGFDDAGNPLKEMRAVSFRDGLFEAIAHHFYHDSRLIAYGEENRDWGGAFGVYRGLTEALPYHRLFNSPISEGAIVGTAVGYALEGGRALVELMYCDFMGRAGDEIWNQLAKWQAMSGLYCRMPVVLRVSVGSKYGAQHSQDWTALCAHVPGLKVVFPATPYGAKGLMAAALSGSDPVVFFESQRIYDVTEQFASDGVPAEYYTEPIGRARVVKPGTDLTILTFGATLYRALEAAERFESEFGISVELIDGQSLVPFDLGCAYESVRKTGKIILGSDACDRGSFLHTAASQITQAAFDELDAPPCVVGAADSIVPPAEMEPFYYPQAEWFLDAYHTQIAPLPGYAPSNDRSAMAQLRRARREQG
jgi:2-oxoisovalerate dehydrogenase E1 component